MKCDNCGGEDIHYNGTDYVCDECGYNITQEKFVMDIKEMKFDVIKHQVEESELNGRAEKIKDTIDIHDILLICLDYEDRYMIGDDEDKNYEEFCKLIGQIDVDDINDKIIDALEWGVDKIKL